MDFLAIDVETANPDMGSICQIGIAGYRGGRIVCEWESLVNPEDWFSPVNTGVHGITEGMVVGAPTLPELEGVLRQHLDGNIVVCHTPFDRVSINQAYCSYALVPPACTWLDTARVARRTWAEVSRRGYGLANVCALIGHGFVHHDALEDAKAAGQIMLEAIKVTGLSIQDWLHRVECPIGSCVVATAGKPRARDANPDGPLYGQIIVFTGALQISRCEAADLAARIGCEVAANVTRRTTMLVVGDQDVTKLAGHVKSSKYRRAEELIASGQAIRILRESDFMRLVGLEDLSRRSGKLV